MARCDEIGISRTIRDTRCVSFRFEFTLAVASFDCKLMYFRLMLPSVDVTLLLSLAAVGVGVGINETFEPLSFIVAPDHSTICNQSTVLNFTSRMELPLNELSLSLLIWLVHLRWMHIYFLSECIYVEQFLMLIFRFSRVGDTILQSIR